MAAEWIGKVVEALKLPLKYMWAVVLVTGFLLFVPESKLKTFGVDSFAVAYRQTVGIVFLSSAAVVIVSAVQFSHGFIGSRLQKRQLIKRAIRNLESLDAKEKAILREFFIQGQDTIQLPVDQANVAGLIKKGGLVVIGSMGEQSLAGVLFPVTIQTEVKKVLDFRHIDLPEKPDDAQIEWLRSERPAFMFEIDRHNETFHTSWERRPIPFL